MDFFARQDHARATTRRLVVLLAIATGGLLIMANVLASWLVDWSNDLWHTGHPRWTHAVVTLGTITIVIVAIWLKARELRLGGPALAVLLGGREVQAATSDPRERQYRNVVEEMAIAAGIPAPAVFVLPSEGINAFAAGHRLDDTAIAVTAGSLIQLSRDELQALVAHESSHLLNGDARINLRLMAMTHGLLALLHTGKLLCRWSFKQSSDDFDRRRTKNALPLLAIGVGLIALGGLADVELGEGRHLPATRTSGRCRSRAIHAQPERRGQPAATHPASGCREPDLPPRSRFGQPSVLLRSDVCVVFDAPTFS